MRMHRSPTVKTAGTKRHLVVGVTGSLEVAPGERTGHLRFGGDQPLHEAQGKRHISMEDFGIAMADEIEQHAHSRQSSTVGY